MDKRQRGDRDGADEHGVDGCDYRRRGEGGVPGPCDSVRVEGRRVGERDSTYKGAVFRIEELIGQSHRRRHSGAGAAVAVHKEVTIIAVVMADQPQRQREQRERKMIRRAVGRSR